MESDNKSHENIDNIPQIVEKTTLEKSNITLTPFLNQYRIEVDCYLIPKKEDDDSNDPYQDPNDTRHPSYYRDSYPVVEDRASVTNQKNLWNVIRDHKLSNSATKLLLYIITHLPKDQDFIKLNNETLEKVFEWKPSNCYKNRRELIELNVIKKKTDTFFWVNPKYIFSGNKVKYYREKQGLGDEAIRIRRFREKINGRWVDKEFIYRTDLDRFLDGLPE